ncbi:hypothetical protein [Actinacidiphila acididurans]|uniref:DUF222 domain-containing protein n=1 Tax=Actinacidiphila acididurans TaxID=2784346 RepID=A0ABS2U373_9ACTN|nr:hypothetical protein [Actinacidiphila acididurans]MBM9510049.1 hypothetical protein [Actinacidiphila acididurans]
MTSPNGLEGPAPTTGAGPDRVLIDATQARAQLQALAVDGYPVTWLAARIGCAASGLGQIRSGQRAHTHRSIAARIHDLHHQYAGTPATDHSVPDHDSSITRTIAGREHWTTITPTTSTPPPARIEDRFLARTTPTADGHLLWNGLPDLYWEGQRHKPGRVAFRIRTGRDPVGHVTADCGHPGCVHPGHVEDAAGRKRLREQLRAIGGLRAATGRMTAQTAPGARETAGRTHTNQ